MILMKCCGQERDSKFCPECGNLLASSIPLEIIKHCRSIVRVRQREIKRHVLSIESGDAVSWHERKLAAARDAEAKYGSWIEWVEKQLRSEQA